MTLHIVPNKSYYITVGYCHLCLFPSIITSHLAYKLVGTQTIYPCPVLVQRSAYWCPQQ